MALSCYLAIWSEANTVALYSAVLSKLRQPPVVNGNSGKFIKSNAENPTEQTKRAAVRIKQQDPELLEWIESQTKSLTREIYLFSDGMVSTSIEVAKREKVLIKLTNFEK
jgi:hypothetical protein